MEARSVHQPVFAHLVVFAHHWQGYLASFGCDGQGFMYVCEGWGQTVHLSEIEHKDAEALTTDSTFASETTVLYHSTWVGVGIV